MKCVSGDVDLSRCAKWKNSCNSQVVIQSPNYFYKIYEEDRYDGKYVCEIREVLGQIYREEYGLFWDVKTFIEDGKIFQIEKRQKIPLCTPELISYPDLLINWSNTLDKLEKKLQLNKITFQLIDHIPNLARVKIIRDCVNKYIDYGFYNGNVILLDDADWFLALIDNNDNWISHECNFYPVELNQNKMIFVPKDINDKDLISSTGERFDQWMLYGFPIRMNKDDIGNFKSMLLSLRKKMLIDNIKIISSKNDECLNDHQLFVSTLTNKDGINKVLDYNRSLNDV